MNDSKVVRTLLGPLLVAVVLLGVGYGAVAQENSRPTFLSVKAVSMRLVSSQPTPWISNWNMTVENNGTIAVILGQICQRTESSNCNEVGPVFWGTPTSSDFYLPLGQKAVFEIVAVNASYAIWELHLQLFPWNGAAPPSNQDVINTANNLPPESEWLFYDSSSNAFIQ